MRGAKQWLVFGAALAGRPVRCACSKKQSSPQKLGRAFIPAVPPMFVKSTTLFQGSIKPSALTRHYVHSYFLFRCLLRREMTLGKCPRLSSPAQSLYGILLPAVRFITAFCLFAKDYMTFCLILSSLFQTFIPICYLYIKILEIYFNFIELQ